MSSLFLYRRRDLVKLAFDPSLSMDLAMKC
jgi:hypothetical protein